MILQFVIKRKKQTSKQICFPLLKKSLERDFLLRLRLGGNNFFITGLCTRYWILKRWFFLEILDKKSLLLIQISNLLKR
jgi:hypothetical protein